MTPWIMIIFIDNNDQCISLAYINVERTYVICYVISVELEYWQWIYQFSTWPCPFSTTVTSHTHVTQQVNLLFTASFYLATLAVAVFDIN